MKKGKHRDKKQTHIKKGVTTVQGKPIPQGKEVNQEHLNNEVIINPKANTNEETSSIANLHVKNETAADQAVQPVIIKQKKLKTFVKASKELLKRRWLFALITLSVFGVATWTFFYLRKSEATIIRGKLSQLGNVEFSYDKFQVESISPLCGCYAEMPANTWRGITFAARYINIQRKSDAPLTEYIILAPQPTNTFWSQSGFKMGMTLYSIALSKNEKFDPRTLINSNFPDNYSVTSKKELPPESFYLFFSRSDMNVALLGDKPLAAWIPADGSNVSIKYEKRMRLAVPLEASIEENYKPHTLSYESEELQGVSMGLPLGDFLGPNVVLWWLDDSPTILTKNNKVEFSTETEKGKKAIVAMVINPPFSVRIALNSATREDIPMLFKELKKKDADIYETPTRYRDAGQVLITILNPEEQVADFDEIYSRMKQNEITIANEIHTDKDIYGTDKISMNFRYPSIPPNKGFNIFGPINNFKFSSALGNLLIGSRQHNIAAPSLLELRHVQSLDVEGGVIPIPIQFSKGSEQFDVQLEAKAEIYINGDSMNEKADEYKFGEHVTTFSLIISLLSGIVSIWSVIRPRK